MAAAAGAGATDYSFAAEYDGPPLPYSLPRAIPLDLSRIPLAALSSSPPASPSASSSPLPVVRPLTPSSLCSAIHAHAHPAPRSAAPAPAGGGGGAVVDSPTSVIENHHAAAHHSAELPSSPSDDEGAGDGDGGAQALPPKPRHQAAVTFAETSGSLLQSSDDEGEYEEDEEEDDATAGEARPRAAAGQSSGSLSPAHWRGGRSRGCYRCGKGGGFWGRDKESCLACGARYCAGCVLRAMGSMPEGRKCLDCIGRPVAEYRRDALGRGSRVLRRLLSAAEVELVMRSERECAANQLRAADVCVNGSKLSPEELVVLQGCPCPPSRLRPGFYWYDKVSGFWGKLAGVQCAGKPHFWVNADGTYQEEGQKTVKGKIWDKPIVKLLSPVLSLPTPNKAANQCGEEAPHMAKFLYKNKPFSVDEREELKLIIQSNIYSYLGILLEGRERFEDEALADRRRNSQYDPSSSGRCDSGFGDEVAEYSLIPRLKAFSDWILKAMALGNLEDIFPAASREYAPLVEELWKDPAIQATYKRRSELPFLPPAASYFLDKAVDISRTEYELSDMDILYADGITSSDGLASTEFSFPQLSLGGQGADEPDPQDTLLRYQLIRINNRGLHENCKWLQMFDDVRLVIFCVAASDYDEYSENANGTIVNKMIESRQLFESITLHPTFEQMDFLLLLTKFDLLDQKINSSPLTSCDWFDDFTPLISRNALNGSSRSTRSSQTGATLAQMAAHYMATKFKRLFDSLTGRKLYVSYVNALDQESVRSAIRYSREIIKWEEEKPVFGVSETVYSEEPSSFTHTC
ncbi:Extra-large guanine nucleotide-binding protein 1 [Dichanthelium oligosanthes]|uniref:Extra-large guanine nucleotide-binding protein 1 n=1 Tax=Dichanthelium oligosanthes TaxID=888268 RepID=A0A1E5W9H4_9POAL|nr:Extra-large guanine nucleotide-binding protein 1 [Dichanthelium oligosanthes]